MRLLHLYVSALKAGHYCGQGLSAHPSYYFHPLSPPQWLVTAVSVSHLVQYVCVCACVGLFALELAE